MSAQTETADVSTTLRLRLGAQTKAKLAMLAGHTRRIRSFLANGATTAYVERELTIVEGIERGLANMQAGRVTPHGEAMRRLRATIAAAPKGR